MKRDMQTAASELSNQDVDTADFSIYCDKLHSIFMEGLGKSFYQKVTGEVYAKLSSVSTLKLKVTPKVIRNQTETSGTKKFNPVPANEDSGTFLIGGHYRTKNPSKRNTDVGRIIILDHINNSFGQLRYTFCTENEITTVDAKMITAEYEFDPDTNNGIVLDQAAIEEVRQLFDLGEYNRNSEGWEAMYRENNLRYTRTRALAAKTSTGTSSSGESDTSTTETSTAEATS